MRFFFLLVFLTTCSMSQSQSKDWENWEQALSKTEEKERITLLYELSWAFRRVKNNQAESLAREGVSLAKKLSDTSAMHQLSANLGAILFYQNQLGQGILELRKSLHYFDNTKGAEFEKARTQLILCSLLKAKKQYVVADSLLVLCEHFFEKQKDLFWLANAALAKGDIALNQKKYEEAIVLYEQALNKSKALNDDQFQGMLLNALGVTERRLANLPEALEYHFETLKIDCDDLTRARCLNNISIVYIKLEDWDNALKYQEEALVIKKHLGFQLSTAHSLNNLGIIHKRRLDFGKALENYKKSLDLKREVGGENTEIGKTLNNIGNIHSRLGETKKAIEYFEQYKSLAIEKDDWEGICRADYNIAFAYFSSEDYKEALPPLLTSYKIANDNGNLHLLEKSNALLAHVYDNLGDTQKSQFHEEQYMVIRDSVINIDKMRKIVELEQQHLNDKAKEKLVKELKEAQKNEIKNYTIKIAIILLSALLILFGIYSYFIKKSKEESQQSLQKTAINSTKLDDYFEELFTRLDNNNEHQLSGLKSVNDPPSDDDEIKSMARFLSQNLKNTSDWHAFEHYFTKIHKDFFKELKTLNSNITPNELNMCALLKLNLQNKEIAQILGVSPDSVRKAQNRLSNKIDLQEGQNLRDFIIHL